MDDEIELQEGSASDDNWEQEVKDRRRRLFQEGVEEPQIPRGRIPSDNEPDLDAFKQEVDSDMDEWASSVMQRRREADERIPPPKPPKIESDFSVFPSVPFRKAEGEKKPFMLQQSIDCPSASAICDSVSASKSKCGYTEYTSASSPPKYYLIKTSVQNTSSTFTGSECSGTTHGSVSSSATDIITYDSATCVSTCSASGSVSLSVDNPSPEADRSCSATRSVCGHTDWTDDAPTNCGGGHSISTGSTTDLFLFGETMMSSRCGGALNGTATESKTQTTHTITAANGTIVATLSDEYDTALLKSNVVAALPAFDGVYNNSCSATYNLSANETSFTLSRVKYKIKLNAAAPCDGVVVQWFEHFQPSPSGSPTNTLKSEAFSEGQIESGVYTIPDPTVNGTTTITSIVVDCSDCPKKQIAGEVDA